MLESGLPGRPNTSVSPRRPNHSGLPGFTRTRQNSSSTPQASKAGLTWSCGPTLTPPETTSTSPLRPASTAARVESKSSAITPPSITCAPARSASSRTISPFDSWILPGSGGAPSGSSSEPVTSRCSRARRWTAISPTPAAASEETRASVSGSPAAAIRSPAWTSSPRKRTCVPGSSTRVARTLPPLSSASSDCRTASAPGGIGAPVVMPTAVPGSSVCVGASPAAISPARRSSPPPVSAARTA